MIHIHMYRLYRAASLALKTRRKLRRPPSERLPLEAATRVNEVCSTGSVSDSLADGRWLKCLTVADGFTARQRTRVECGLAFRRLA